MGEIRRKTKRENIGVQPGNNKACGLKTEKYGNRQEIWDIQGGI